jgi:hypothetical protein
VTGAAGLPNNGLNLSSALWKRRLRRRIVLNAPAVPARTRKDGDSTTTADAGPGSPESSPRVSGCRWPPQHCRGICGPLGLLSASALIQPAGPAMQVLAAASIGVLLALAIYAPWLSSAPSLGGAASR